MITAGQLRAARGLLDWTRADLAKAAEVSPETIKNIEHGTFRPQESTAEAIVRAFATHDVEFVENEGVRRQKSQVKTFSGVNGYKEFLDHVYATLRDRGGNIRQFNTSEGVLTYAPEYSAMHLERMSKIPNLDARVLVMDGDYDFPAPYCTYRWLNRSQTKIIPYYLYGNNVSMFSTKWADHVEIVSIHSELLAAIFLEQFEWFWDSATIPPSKGR